MKQFKKAISVLVTLCLVISLMSVTAFAAEYDDTEGHWAETYIDKWSDYGVVQGMGDGTFQPNGPVTRAQAAQVFANLLGLTATVSDISAIFRDVPADAWFADAIAKCYAAGIMLGNGDGTMTPNELLTREQFFTMFARAIAITQGTPSAEAKEDMADKGYKDADKVSDYAADSVKSLIDLGWVNGITLDTLAPQDTINRASVMKVLGTAISTYVGPDQDVTEVKAEGDGITLIANPNVEVVSGKADFVVVAAGAEDIELQVAEGAEIEQLNVTAPGAVISGEGDVDKVVATTLDVTVKTADTAYELTEQSSKDGTTSATTIVGKTDENGKGTGETKTETTVKETAGPSDATTEKTSALTKTDADGKVIEQTNSTSKVVEATAADGSKTTTTSSTKSTTDADGKTTQQTINATVNEAVAADGTKTTTTEATVSTTDAAGKTSKTTTEAKVSESTAADGTVTTTSEVTKSTTAAGKTAKETTTSTVTAAADGTVTTKTTVDKVAADGTKTKTEVTETAKTTANEDGSVTVTTTTEAKDADGKTTKTEVTATATANADGSVTTETTTKVTGADGKTTTTEVTATAVENADGTVTTETTTKVTDADGKVTETTETETALAEVNTVSESAGVDITEAVDVGTVSGTGTVIPVVTEHTHSFGELGWYERSTDNGTVLSFGRMCSCGTLSLESGAWELEEDWEISRPLYIAAGQTIELNLNGYNIIANGMDAIYNLGTLTLTSDGFSLPTFTTDANGNLNFDASAMNGYVIVNNGSAEKMASNCNGVMSSGTLTMEAVGVAVADTYGNAFVSAGDGVATIKNSALINTGLGNAVYANSGAVTLDTGTVAWGSTYGYAVFAYNASTVNVKGGSYYSTAGYPFCICGGTLEIEDVREAMGFGGQIYWLAGTLDNQTADEFDVTVALELADDEDIEAEKWSSQIYVSKGWVPGEAGYYEIDVREYPDFVDVDKLMYETDTTITYGGVELPGTYGELTTLIPYAVAS